MENDYMYLLEGSDLATLLLDPSFFESAAEFARSQGLDVMFKGGRYVKSKDSPHADICVPFLLARNSGEGFRGAILQVGSSAIFRGKLSPREVSFEAQHLNDEVPGASLEYRGTFISKMGRFGGYSGEWEIRPGEKEAEGFARAGLETSGPLILLPYGPSRS